MRLLYIGLITTFFSTGVSAWDVAESLDDAGDAMKEGLKKGEAGAEKGVDKASAGVDKAAKSTETGLQKAAKETEEGLHKAADAIGSFFDGEE